MSAKSTSYYTLFISFVSFLGCLTTMKNYDILKLPARKLYLTKRSSKESYRWSDNEESQPTTYCDILLLRIVEGTRVYRFSVKIRLNFVFHSSRPITLTPSAPSVGSRSNYKSPSQSFESGNGIRRWRAVYDFHERQNAAWRRRDLD